MNATDAELIVGRLSAYSAELLLRALCGGDEPGFFFSEDDCEMAQAVAAEDAPRLMAVARTLIPADLRPLVAPLAAKSCKS